MPCFVNADLISQIGLVGKIVFALLILVQNGYPLSLSLLTNTKLLCSQQGNVLCAIRNVIFVVKCCSDRMMDLQIGNYILFNYSESFVFLLFLVLRKAGTILREVNGCGNDMDKSCTIME